MKDDHKKQSDGVIVAHEKDQWGESSPLESDGVRLQHEKEQWGES